jgi:hypothetical protein
MSAGPLIAGEVSLPEVMARLQQDRPVFHSEADLQHSFARVLWELAPKIQSRLEVRQNAPDALGAEYLYRAAAKSLTRGIAAGSRA